MTIIAYSPGMLAADSRAVCRNDQLGDTAILSTQVRTKLKLIGNGRIAVATCGPILIDEEWEEIERLLVHYLMILEVGDEKEAHITFEEEHREASVFKHRFAMVMTKQHVYFIGRTSSDLATPAMGLQRMDPSESMAYGSAMHIAYVAFAAGMDAEKMVHFVIEQDQSCGPPVVVVRQEDMRPMISLPGRKKKVAA